MAENLCSRQQKYQDINILFKRNSSESLLQHNSYDSSAVSGFKPTNPFDCIKGFHISGQTINADLFPVCEVIAVKNFSHNFICNCGRGLSYECTFVLRLISRKNILWTIHV